MIPVQNIYYMLAYAFNLKTLREAGYKNLATEHFDNVAELCSAILVKGTTSQLKQGLGREYVEEKDALSTLRGKIEISESIKEQTMILKKMVCTYDEFSVNSYRNRIIKTTMEMLLKSDISKKRKRDIQKVLVYFSDVETLDIHNINWKLQYDRNNQTYRMMITICYLVIHDLLQTKSSGTLHQMDFDEVAMDDLYERFIREYYRQEHPQLNVSASTIPWALDDGSDEMLPEMKSDITISHGDKVLIIDTKYYEGSNTQTHYRSNENDAKNISKNLYQIFTYVKNKALEDTEGRHTVSGMLLYGRTDREIQPRQIYSMSGNRITVTTLDLNCSFAEIRTQLDGIIEKEGLMDPKKAELKAN